MCYVKPIQHNTLDLFYQTTQFLGTYSNRKVLKKIPVNNLSLVFNLAISLANKVI